MLPRLWLLVGPKGQTMSVIELSWTAKKVSGHMGIEGLFVNEIVQPSRLLNVLSQIYGLCPNPTQFNWKCCNEAIFTIFLAWSLPLNVAHKYKTRWAAENQKRYFPAYLSSALPQLGCTSVGYFHISHLQITVMSKARQIECVKGLVMLNLLANS